MGIISIINSIATTVFAHLVNNDSCDTVNSGYQCNTSISHSWGQYSPYFTVPSKISNAEPPFCSITFVQSLNRHGARDPTASKTAKYSATVAQIHSNTTSYGPGFEFIESYQYTLGADQLTSFGQQEMINSGFKFFQRYQQLATNNTPFFRSSGENRVVMSAENFIQGYHAAKVIALGDDTSSYKPLVLSEEKGVNNTLDQSECTNFENDDYYASFAVDAQAAWLSVFAPNITARLNENLQGAGLTDNQTIYMMDLCPFNTIASHVGVISEWCTLFTPNEWKSYSYYNTLGKYYGYGDGNPLGPTQGVGFANELIARLTNKPVVDRTSTNSTIDALETTFPLGLPMYADFSHGSDMTAMFSALGLYNDTSPLSTHTIQDTDETNGYSASYTIPFAARAYIEKMTCLIQPYELVRVILNDRVVPLQNCGADSLGRCKLDAFVDSLSFARSSGHWDKCFE
ncbi:histidine phosphatase superfamily [Calycina marina]|uniref:Phytase A n=1 Tax=Calycina marina TaxID=1763456 RepID=A0A9P7Z4B7_9HELO|nr:histidine phosphatase superfamily [Calycina marina]